MTLYNTLPRKEYELVLMCNTVKELWHILIITHQCNSQVNNCKINLLTQEYEKFLISNEETIDSGFTRFNAIRAKVTVFEEAKHLATLPLDELIGNLKVYEMILASDGVASKPIKEKVMPIVLKANVIRGQTSNDNICHDGSDEDEDKEEEFNYIVKNPWKLFKKGNRFARENRFCNGDDRFNRGHMSKGVRSSKGKHICYGCGSKNHSVDDCPKEKMKRAFFGGAWSDS
nr:hypothetical protein [Tanacetum cinerariifolium]